MIDATLKGERVGEEDDGAQPDRGNLVDLGRAAPPKANLDLSPEIAGVEPLT